MVLAEIIAEVIVLEGALVLAVVDAEIHAQAVVVVQALVHRVALAIAGLDAVAHVKHRVLDVLEIVLADVVHVKDVVDVVLVDVAQHAEATVVDIV